MPTLKERQAKVLSETIKFYNSKNRSAVTPDGTGVKCVYFKEEGHPGCAVGRLIKGVRLRKLLDKSSDNTVDGVFFKLPKNVQSLGRDFLACLQSLHDGASYWNPTGLSRGGKDMAKFIIDDFELDLKID